MKRLSKIIVALTLCMTMIAGAAMPVLAAGGKHAVTFMYGAKQVVQMVDDGCDAIPPTDTYAPGYNFLGWTGNATNVTEDRILIGAYAKDDPAPAPQPAPQPAPAARTYTVTFVDSLTGGQYYKQVVSEGADANPPEVPHHPGYHFEGYSDSYTNVTSDRTIYVQYGWDYDFHHDNPSNWWWLYDDGDGNPYNPYVPYWWM